MNFEAAVPRRVPALVFLSLGAALALFAPAPAAAQTWNEVGDAGDMIATAQTTIGSGPLSLIQGQLASSGDVDIFCVKTDQMPNALNIPVVSL